MGGTHIDGVIVEDGKIINTVKTYQSRQSI